MKSKTNKQAALYDRVVIVLAATAIIVLGLISGDESYAADYSSWLSESQTDLDVAGHDSFGFFHGIPQDIWEIRKHLTLSTRHRKHTGLDPVGKVSPQQYFQENWEPDFSCFNEKPLGNMGDGHKWVCDPHRVEALAAEAKTTKGNDDDCLVYSVGSNGQFDFETDVQANMPSCEIHVFDFADFSGKIPPNLNLSYHVWGLKPSYKTELRNSVHFKYANHALWEGGTKGGIFKTIQETVTQLGHEGRKIDIFKIDCEGCEYYSYKDWLQVDLRQILIEVHMTPDVTDSFFAEIHDANYAMFHKEPNIQYGGGKCVEFSFIKLAPSFFGKTNEAK